MSEQTESRYLRAIKRLLPRVKLPPVRLAAYDTGFGLSVCQEMGPEVSTLTAVSERFLKIPVPPAGIREDWERDWTAAVRFVSGFLEAHNARLAKPRGEP